MLKPSSIKGNYKIVFAPSKPCHVVYGDAMMTLYSKSSNTITLSTLDRIDAN